MKIFELFTEQVRRNGTLRTQVEKLVDKDSNIAFDALVALGVEHGYEFTAGDIRQYKAMRRLASRRPRDTKDTIAGREWLHAVNIKKMLF